MGRKLENLVLVGESARAKASSVGIYQADLTVDEDIHKLTNRLRQDFPLINLLILGAGVISIGAVESAPAAFNEIRQSRGKLLSGIASETRQLAPLTPRMVGQQQRKRRGSDGDDFLQFHCAG